MLTEYDLIKNNLSWLWLGKTMLKQTIKDFIGDVKMASGVVAVKSLIYQDVILAILDVNEE